MIQGGIAGLTAATQFVVAIVLMLIYSLPLGGAFLLTVPFYLLLMVYSSRRVAPTYESLEEEYGRFRSEQIDAIKGIATVKAMGAEDGMRGVLVRNLRELGRKAFRSDFTIMAYQGITQVVTFVTVVAFLFFGALEVLAHNLTIGGLIAFNSLIVLANAPLGALLALWDEWLQSRVLLGRMQDIFDYGEEQPGAPGAFRAVRPSKGTWPSVGRPFTIQTHRQPRSWRTSPSRFQPGRRRRSWAVRALVNPPWSSVWQDCCR